MSAIPPRLAAMALLLCACRGSGPGPGPRPEPTPEPTGAAVTPPAPTEGVAEVGPAERYFGNAELVNQDGARLRFFTDLLKGRVVIIHSFFSSCTGSCPVMAGTFAKLQEHLGDRLGRDVVMLSISVDPTHDTPQRLKEWADRYHARRGWHLLTGEAASVAAVLGKLGQAVNAPADHSSIMLVGNVPTGLWKKVFGLGKADEVIRIVDEVLADPGTNAPRP